MDLSKFLSHYSIVCDGNFDKSIRGAPLIWNNSIVWDRNFDKSIWGMPANWNSFKPQLYCQNLIGSLQLPMYYRAASLTLHSELSKYSCASIFNAACYGAEGQSYPYGVGVRACLNSRDQAVCRSFDYPIYWLQGFSRYQKVANVMKLSGYMLIWWFCVFSKSIWGLVCFAGECGSYGVCVSEVYVAHGG